MVMWLSRTVIQRAATLPWIGNWFRRRCLVQALKDLDYVELAFTKPSVHFHDNVHLLYDSLKGVQLPAGVTHKDYHDLSIACHTKTSKTACELLESMDKAWGNAPETYFKTGGINQLTPMLDWYSNESSLLEFYQRALEMLFVFMQLNPKSQDGNVYLGMPRGVSQRLEEFLNNRLFKLLVLDLIAVSRLVYQLELWRHDGKE